ncbi:MAG: PKD domain-containing protein, partial [Myxococcaceae bacterium]
GNGPEFELSAHWDSSHGFSSNKAVKTPSLSGTANFSGSVSAHAQLPVKMRLLLYDVGGVETKLTPELSARLQSPGKPLWTLDGEFKGEIGVAAELPIVGDLGSYDTTLFDESFHLAQSLNVPPRVVIVSPFPGQAFDVAPPDDATVYLRAVASDAEDGPNCCTLRWKLTDGTPLVAGNDVPYTFPRAGHYDVVATATDSDGASTDSAPVGLDITAYPPGARIVLPAAECEEKLYAGYPVRLRGSDTRPPLAPLPYDCNFGSTALLTGGIDSAFPVFVSRDQVGVDGCDTTVRFAFPDWRRIHLLVRQYNPDGTLGLGSVVDRDIPIQAPPPGAIPIFLSPGPPGCAQELLGYTAGRLDLYVQTFGDPSTGVSWTWQPDGCAAVAVPTHKAPLGVCTPDYCPSHWEFFGPDVYFATPPGCGGLAAAGKLVVTTTSAAGPPQSATVFVRLFDDVIH